jgi:hypothetical protein
VANEGIAEIALQGVTHEAGILDIPWPIEAHLYSKFLDLLDGHMVGRVTQDHLGGIACHEQHAERDNTDSENDDEGLEQATN